MPKVYKNRYFIIAVCVIVIVALTGGAFYFGYQKGTQKPQTVIIRGVANLEEGKPEAVDFSLFWDAWRTLKEKYVDADKINNQDLVYGAVSGLLGSLKDPNSVFMPPSDAKKFNEDIKGEFSGIGAEIGIRNDQLVIVAPLKNTPAERAGLESGDKILKIDDTITFGLNVDEAVKLIRGEKGTTVVLTILRNGWEKSREIPIVRDVIQVPTLDWEIKNGNILYLHLYNFYEQAPFLMYRAIVQNIFHDIRGIVLDLRDNPGGFLEASVDIAGWFLERGATVVSEEFASGEKEVFKASGSGLFKNTPMVVLINQGSASASEILAGALRDNRGIKLIGKKSFGKGTVQEMVELKDKSVVKITVAHWILPKGLIIEKNGLAPDYEINLTDEDREKKRDPQLEKAIEVLKNEISNF